MVCFHIKFSDDSVSVKKNVNFCKSGFSKIFHIKIWKMLKTRLLKMALHFRAMTRKQSLQHGKDMGRAPVKMIAWAVVCRFCDNIHKTRTDTRTRKCFYKKGLLESPFTYSYHWETSDALNKTKLISLTATETSPKGEQKWLSFNN